jgi:hypothetical protein
MKRSIEHGIPGMRGITGFHGTGGTTGTGGTSGTAAYVPGCPVVPTFPGVSGNTSCTATALGRTDTKAVEHWQDKGARLQHTQRELHEHS